MFLVIQNPDGTDEISLLLADISYDNDYMIIKCFCRLYLAQREQVWSSDRSPYPQLVITYNSTFMSAFRISGIKTEGMELICHTRNCHVTLLITRTSI